MEAVEHACNGWGSYVQVVGYVDRFCIPFFSDQLVDDFYIVFFSRRLLSSAWFVGSGQFCQLALSGSSLRHLCGTLRFGDQLFKGVS